MNAPRAWLVGRRSAGHRLGGDAMQVEETAAVLDGGGWDARVLADPHQVHPARGDTVHLHNIQRVHDWSDLPERAREAGARLLISPLFHPLGRYHREGRRGLDALAAKVLPEDLFAGLRWGRPGVKERAAEVLRLADRVLLVHEREAELLREELGFAPAPERRVVVPVAVAAPPGGPPPEGPFGEEPFALCAARLEPLKDAVGVIRAADAAGVPLALAGPSSGARHAGYAAQVRAAALRSGRVALLGELPHREVLGLMAAARVHVLASWTEVVGRATLEAATAGCAVVLTDVGHAPDYLGRHRDGVYVVPPGSPVALATALRLAWQEGRPGPDSELAAHARAHYTWAAVGPRLLKAYA